MDSSGGGGAAGFAALPTGGGAGTVTGLALLAGAAGFAFACWEALAKVTDPVKMAVIVEAAEAGGKGAPAAVAIFGLAARPAPCTPPPPPRRIGGRDRHRPADRHGATP